MFYESYDVVRLVLFVCEVCILALLDLFCYEPFFCALLFRRFEVLHKEVVSDIPGNPHAFDSAVISLFRTLPEPSNLNLVWTNLPFDEPLVVRGKIPNARCNSLSVYGQGKSDPPNSIELHACGSRLFEVTVAQSSRISADGELSCNDWKRGFCAMRNYLVPPGTLVRTPEIIRARDGKIVRKSQSIVTGPSAFSRQPSNILKAIIRGSVVNSIATSINLIFLRMWISIYTNICILSAGLLVSNLLYFLSFRIGRKTLASFAASTCKTLNKFALATLDAGSKASQPSTLHTYWVMIYDLKSGTEVSITGKINTENQKYWSLVAYDLYGLPLPQYIYDANVVENPITSTTEDSTSKSPESTGRIYAFDIRLRNFSHTSYANHSDRSGCSSGSASKASDIGETVLDVSKASTGYILFRLVHPSGPYAIEFSAPSSKVIQLHPHKQKEKDI